MKTDTPSMAEIVGAQIKARREELGWSQHRLAARLDLPDERVSRWERGVNVPRDPVLDLLAEVLGCSKHDLFAPLD